ncbi:hypothetical protein KCU61_g5567, partial [Aureobasidium melanogenum]
MSHAPSTANPSALAKLPLHLPNEILQRIAQFADDEDLPALRATSKVIYDETRTRFADAFFTNVYYPAAPEGLERLTRIAEHLLFSQKVRNCIAIVKKSSGRYDDLEMEKPLGDIAAVMQGRNFGISLVEDQSHYTQYYAAWEYAEELAFYGLERFTVDVHCPSGSALNNACFLVELGRLQDELSQSCAFVIRFLHNKARNSPALATFEVSHYGRKIGSIGWDDYFTMAQSMQHELIEIDFSQWKMPGSNPRDSLEHIVRRHRHSLQRLIVRNAHATSSWMHKILIEAIMLCSLDFCHLSNLTSSGDGVEFTGTLEASGMDNIRACLQDMKWTSKIGEEVVEIA